MTWSTSDGGGLLLQRFAQLVEQPGVLDGDDRLAGEVLHQLDLLVGERANLLAVDGNTPISSSPSSIGTPRGAGAGERRATTGIAFA